MSKRLEIANEQEYTMLLNFLIMEMFALNLIKKKKLEIRPADWF